MIDILLTTYNRKGLLKVTLESLLQNTRPPYRLFVIDDASTDGTQEYLCGIQHECLTAVVLSKVRQGVVYGFNQLWNLADYYDAFVQEAPYMCYLQDDMRVMEYDWLGTLIEAYEELRATCPIGFFSGYDCIEHITQREFEWRKTRTIIKCSSGAPNLIAEKSFWRSIGYIPKYNPDGTARGNPSRERGSHIDLYLTGCMSKSRYVKGAAAPNCSYRQGKGVLVIPGLLQHMGQENHSTWRIEAA